MDAETQAFREELDNFSAKDLAKLYSYELRWQTRQPWLAQRGYQLRPRFRPGWVPSWNKYEWLPTWIKYDLMNPFSREDSLALEFGDLIMDAVRVSDGAFVIMKVIDKERHPYEVEISKYLSSPELARDPRNHCVPILDSFDAPNDPTRAIIVMPLLKRFDIPPFETVGEVVECLTQLFEGLEFIHMHHVAHRDCYWPNIMMDASPIYPIPYHPADPSRRRDWKGEVKHLSRTERPVRYYFIDFGLSRRYDPSEVSPRELPIIPGDKSVPEHQGGHYDEPADPFATDIYLLGNAIRERLTRHFDPGSLDFLDPLLSDMTLEDPQGRPKIHDVVVRFAALKSGLDAITLSSRLTHEGVAYRSSMARSGFWSRLRGRY